MLAMTYRYVFLFVETAVQMFESRRSRTVGTLKPSDQRQMAARTAGVLLSKSVALSNDVYLAMQARGFRGDVQILVRLSYDSAGTASLCRHLCSPQRLAVWMGR